MLQQLESSQSQDVSVNDCFKPVSRYWDRINRPEQIVTALPEAMRVLTSPAETGAVTLALPQDVQAEALRLSRRAVRAARVDDRRARAPDRDRLRRGGGADPRERATDRSSPAAACSTARRPDALRRFVDATGIAVGETQAGKGVAARSASAVARRRRRDRHARRPTSSRATPISCIVVGSRLSDFTTASKTAFQHEGVRFIAINVAEIDAGKHAALPLVGDARAVLDELLPLRRRLPRRRGLRRASRRVAERLASRSRSAVQSAADPQLDPQSDPQSAIRNP